MNIALGHSKFRLAAIASLFDSVSETFGSNELRSEVVIDSENSKTHFSMLMEKTNEIESMVGEAMTWHNPSKKRMCRIFLRKPAVLTDRGKWPEYHAWLLEKLELLHRIFSPLVKQLDVPGHDAMSSATDVPSNQEQLQRSVLSQ